MDSVLACVDKENSIPEDEVHRESGQCEGHLPSQQLEGGCVQAAVTQAHGHRHIHTSM